MADAGDSKFGRWKIEIANNRRSSRDFLPKFDFSFGVVSR